MKISLIATVFNEENSISEFLQSIINQSTFPDELIIVDGVSTDKTIEKINDYKLKIKDKGIKFKLITKKGNIATGRNGAIKNASYDFILCSDVGCLLDRKWIENISKPFVDKNIDVVAGFYIPKCDSVFEKSLATYTSVMPDKVDPKNFLPSSRSIAFRKSAWKSVGGYPEWLDTCEDLYFARELKRKEFNFKFAKNAIVYWPQRRNIKEAFIQFFNYAKGDGIARYIRPNTPFLFARYIIGLFLFIIALKASSVVLFSLILFALIMYVLWAVLKNYKYVKNSQALIYLPVLQFTADFAVLSGMSIGFIKSLAINKVKT